MRESNPAPVGVVGVGRMGRGVVDQVATMTGMEVRALCDLDVERALRGFTENGWSRDQVTVTEDVGSANDALRRGGVVATADPLLLIASRHVRSSQPSHVQGTNDFKHVRPSPAPLSEAAA